MRDVSRDVRSRDSCQRGWRLLYILTAFHRCSEVLKPFLFKYLQHAYLSAGVLFQGAPLTLIQLSKHAFFSVLLLSAFNYMAEFRLCCGLKGSTVYICGHHNTNQCQMDGHIFFVLLVIYFFPIRSH